MSARPAVGAAGAGAGAGAGGEGRGALEEVGVEVVKSARKGVSRLHSRQGII